MRKYHSIFLAVALTVCSVLTGCAGHVGKSGMTVEDLRKKYSASTEYDVSSDTYTVDTDECIHIQAQADQKVIFEKYFESAHEETPFIVYTDDKLENVLFVPQLKRNTDGSFDIDPKEITMDESFMYQSKQYTLSGKGTWGVYDTLYLARYNDLKTGKKLDRPIVYIVDINHGKNTLEAPVVTKQITNDGNLRLEWQPVEGATCYWIIKRERLSESSSNDQFTYASKNLYSYVSVVRKTNFTSDEQTKSYLIQKDYSADDLLDPKKAADAFVVEQVNKEPKDYDLFVIAQDKKKVFSSLSNGINASEFTSFMPMHIAHRTLLKNTDDQGFVLHDVEQIPTTVPVVMMDGSIRNYPLQYNLKKGKFYFSKHENKNIYDLPIGVKNTPFTDKITVYGASEDYKNIMKSKQKEVDAFSKTGISTLVVKAQYKKKLNLDKSTIANTVAAVDYDYVAHSPLEEYIVTNMLAGNFNLDMSAFPEAKDHLALSQAFSNIVKNNPVIANIPSYYYSDAENLLQISVSKTEVKQQKKIVKKIDEIKKSIIKDNMTDKEKSEAINHYLIEHTEFDQEALAAIREYEAVKENPSSSSAQIRDAENNRMQYIDSSSVTGVLFNGKAVCSGYADVYRLLAAYAGLDVLTVSGMGIRRTVHMLGILFIWMENGLL